MAHLGAAGATCSVSLGRRWFWSGSWASQHGSGQNPSWKPFRLHVARAHFGVAPPNGMGVLHPLHFCEVQLHQRAPGQRLGRIKA